MGHEVFSAGTISAARSELPASGCNVLISDIYLHDGTGWDLLNNTLLTSPIYAIAMSASPPEELESLNRQAGFKAFLTKPFTISALNLALSSARSWLAGLQSQP